MEERKTKDTKTKIENNFNKLLTSCLSVSMVLKSRKKKHQCHIRPIVYIRFLYGRFFFLYWRTKLQGNLLGESHQHVRFTCLIFGLKFFRKLFSFVKSARSIINNI